jgi:hypothetical protein
MAQPPVVSARASRLGSAVAVARTPAASEKGTPLVSTLPVKCWSLSGAPTCMLRCPPAQSHPLSLLRYLPAMAREIHFQQFVALLVPFVVWSYRRFSRIMTPRIRLQGGMPPRSTLATQSLPPERAAGGSSERHLASLHPTAGRPTWVALGRSGASV